MTTRGILVLLIAFATTACTTRQGARTGVLVGFGMFVGGGALVAVKNDSGNNNQVSLSGTQLFSVVLLMTGVIVAGLSGVALVATDDDKPAPTALASKPEPPDDLLQVKRVARHLARTGHCDQVRDLSVQVAQRDPTFHAQVFSADATIAGCLVARPME